VAGAARAEGSFSGAFILAAAFEEPNLNPLCAGWYCNLISVFGIVDEDYDGHGSGGHKRRNKAHRRKYKQLYVEKFNEKKKLQVERVRCYGKIFQVLFCRGVRFWGR